MNQYCIDTDWDVEMFEHCCFSSSHNSTPLLETLKFSCCAGTSVYGPCTEDWCVTLCCAAVPHWKELVDALLFGRGSGGAIVMIAHVRAARGHGLLFHSPTHTSTCAHTHAHAFFLMHFFAGVYHFYTKTCTHTDTQVWNLRPFPLSICRGYLCDTSSHPSLWLISTHHAHLGASTWQLGRSTVHLRG